MINTKDPTSFIRNFLLSSDIDFFLGSGASLLAGIPSGQNLVWQFKKEIYCYILDSIFGFRYVFKYKNYFVEFGCSKN